MRQYSAYPKWHVVKVKQLADLCRMLFMTMTWLQKQLIIRSFKCFIPNDVTIALICIERWCGENVATFNSVISSLWGLFLTTGGRYCIFEQLLYCCTFLWLLLLADVTIRIPPLFIVVNILLETIITGLVPGFILRCRVWGLLFLYR
jgi:hypothetical protein